jgi:hypothetical protein
MKVTEISRAEWDDYYCTQQSGTINMWQHPNIQKFAPPGNYAAALKHFEEDGSDDLLVIATEDK